ncbi:MAG: hypothetical protein ACJASC_003389 [Limimaricola cinnabarinus]|jgi:hypothetical protein
MVTDKLGSYAAAKAKIVPGLEHRQHKEINVTTRPKRRTGTPDDEKRSWDGSNPHGRPSGSCPSTTKPLPFFARTVVASRPVPPR